MSLSRISVLALRGARNSSTTSNVHPGYLKLNAVKERFSIEDGTPVFKKNGAFDRLLYGLTLAACVAALGLDIKTYYDFALK